MAILTNTSGRGGIQVNKREEEIKKILKEADKDGDGGLNKEELKQAFRELGAHVPWWRARCCLRRADTNNDGVIAGEELNEVVSYAMSKYGYKIGN